jgi:hypothetical protein
VDDYKRKYRLWNACCCIEGCVTYNFTLRVCYSFFAFVRLYLDVYSKGTHYLFIVGYAGHVGF